MLSAGKSTDQGGIGPSQQALQTEQSVERWLSLVDQGAPLEVIQQAEQQVAEALKQSPFELRSQLPFFQQAAKRLDATLLLQHFRLPGRERLIEDRRDQFQGEPAQKEAAKETAKETAKEAVKSAAQEAAKKVAEKGAESKVSELAGKLTLKDGKLVEHKERTYTNFLGARELTQARGREAAAATTRVEEMLTGFERLVVERFEKGGQVAQQSPDGKAHFKPKSEGEWSAFFKSFLDRTVHKKALVDEVREFLFRGSVARGQKGIFIGDMHLTNGQVEKFVRFSILADALAKLKAMAPGEKVGADALGKLSGEELMYLALAAARSQEFATSMAPTQGKFALGSTEEKAAQALGIPLDRHLQQKAKQLKRGAGGFKGFFDKDPEPEEIPYQFTPWWSWGNLQRQSPTRWITRVMYGSLLIVALLGIAVMTARLLKGGF